MLPPRTAAVCWLWSKASTPLLPFLHLVNDTEEVGPLRTVDISSPDTTNWILRDLEPVSKYKFYLRSCTTVGCGPVVSEECTTTLETSEWWRVQKAIDEVVYVRAVWAGESLPGGEHWGALRCGISRVEFRQSEEGDEAFSLLQNGIELVEYDICLGSQAFHISM